MCGYLYWGVTAGGVVRTWCRLDMNCSPLRWCSTRTMPASVSWRIALSTASTERRRRRARGCGADCYGPEGWTFRGGARPLPVASTSPRQGPRECRRWETSWSHAPPPVIGGRLPLMSGTPALPIVGGPWASQRQSFRIEVPCNISCNISRRIGVSAGQSRLLTARCHSLERDKTAGQKPPDLRLRWWPGAGSNRRPSDFQSDARTN